MLGRVCDICLSAGDRLKFRCHCCLFTISLLLVKQRNFDLVGLWLESLFQNSLWYILSSIFYVAASGASVVYNFRSHNIASAEFEDEREEVRLFGFHLFNQTGMCNIQLRTLTLILLTRCQP